MQNCWHTLVENAPQQNRVHHSFLCDFAFPRLGPRQSGLEYSRSLKTECSHIDHWGEVRSQRRSASVTMQLVSL
eukprot:1724229-Amphidinium_carterae.1